MTSHSLAHSAPLRTPTSTTAAAWSPTTVLHRSSMIMSQSCPATKEKGIHLVELINKLCRQSDPTCPALDLTRDKSEWFKVKSSRKPDVLYHDEGQYQLEVDELGHYTTESQRMLDHLFSEASDFAQTWKHKRLSTKQDSHGEKNDR